MRRLLSISIILVTSIIELLGQPTFTVTLSSSPADGGITTGSGIYDSDASVLVTATPNSGYTFVNWEEGGGEVSTSTNYNFNIASNRTLVANFTLNSYTIETSSSPSEGGSTSGGGTFNSGTLVTVTATPSAGYRFVYWTEGGTSVSTNTSYTFTVSSNRTLLANFILIYTISTSSNPSEGGSAAGSGIYDSGASVTATANPAAGYRFINWTEDGTTVSTNASYTFTATANRTLIANFLQTFSVTTSSSPAAGGSTTGSGTYDSGASVTVTATPAPGYLFLNWTESGAAVSSNATYTFTASANRALIATYIQTFTISTSSTPATGGTTNGGGTFNSGTSVTVSSTPASGYRFVNWTENGTSVSTSPSYTFSASVDRTLVANFVLIYTINSSSSPAAGGSTTGSGTYDSGASVTVTANPAAGYRFANWTEDGTTVSANASYTFTATASHTLIANFLQTFSVTTSSSPAAGGSTTGSGTYDSGTSVTVSATPAAGYRFVNWTESGVSVSTNASYSFTTSSNRTLVANFMRTFSVSTSASPASGGSTTGSGTYDSGSSVTISATSASGYHFVNWTESGVLVSTNTTYTFTASANRTLVANFIQIFTFSTSSSPAAGGSTSGGGSFDSGTSVTVTATPTAGYRFVNWTESGTSVSTSPSYTFTASANRTLAANFILIYTVSTSSSPSAGGSTTGSGTYDSGTLVTVTATPAAGYRFVNWTESGVSVSINASFTFTTSSNRTLVANYILVYTLNTSASPSAGGSTTGSGTYDSGTSVTVTATPSEGYRFVNWTQSGASVSVNTTYTFTASANRTLVANFIQIFAISTSSNPAAGGSTSGGGTFESATPVTVTATPAAGYRFVNWSESGVSVSANTTYTFAASADRTLAANFIQIFAISTSSSPATGGSTSGGGTFESGTPVTVTATPAAGYRFVNWTVNGAAVSTNSSYLFTVSTNRALTANFIRITYIITISSNPAAGGECRGGGTYNSGDQVTVTAIPGLGYQFYNWTENGSVVSSGSSYSFTLAANRILVANFSIIPVIFNITGTDGTLVHNNDTIKLNSPDAASFSLKIESNFDWSVNENSLWLSAVKENSTSLRINCLENISLLGKITHVRVTNQLNDAIQFYLQQKERVSLLGSDKFKNVKMYPNPANNFIYFQLGEYWYEKILICISSLNGNILELMEFHNLPGNETLQIKVSGLGVGHYFLTIGDGINKRTFRMIKY